MSEERQIHRVLFFDRGRVCEIYAKVTPFPVALYTPRGGDEG